MADVTAYMGPDPWTELSSQHSDIRREGSVERGEIRYDVATKAGDIRRETAEGISEVRYDVATRSSDNRYANAIGQADIRREQALGFGDTKYSIAEHSEATNRDILVTGANTAVKVDEAADKIQQRQADFYIAGQARDFENSRDLAAIRATTDLASQKLSTEILLSGERAAAAAALAGEKTAAASALESARLGTAVALESARLGAAVALGQSQLSKEIAESKYDTSKQIAYENEKTRDLINGLKNDELNRILIERNTDLTHCRHDYWAARDGMFNAQFAALSSQVNSQTNALNSQLAETRQGMVNFGTMRGVGQDSTSNAVR